MGCASSKPALGDPWELAATGQRHQLESWLQAGGDPDALDRQGGRGTLLHAAARGGHVQCVQVLLRAGADVNAVTRLLGSPLHAAVESGGNQAILRVLLDSGADPLLKNAAGVTAVDEAVARGNQAAVDMLRSAARSQAAAGSVRSEAAPTRKTYALGSADMAMAPMRQASVNPGSSEAALGPTPPATGLQSSLSASAGDPLLQWVAAEALLPRPLQPPSAAPLPGLGQLGKPEPQLASSSAGASGSPRGIASAAFTSAAGSSRPTGSQGMDDLSFWEINFEELTISRPIGEGSFGKTYLATWHETPVAVKVLRDLRDMEGAPLSLELTQKLHKECTPWASMRHPNVIQFMGLVVEPPAIVTEYCSRGSIYDVLKACKASPDKAAQMTWPRRLNMALDVARGLLYLDHRGFIHGDFSSPNLLVDESWRVKVAGVDFKGLVGSKDRDERAMNPRWLAPEVLNGERRSSASNCFVLGITLWELLTFELPFSNTNAWQIVADVRNGRRPPIPPRDQLPGPDTAAFAGADAYIALMQQCWAQEPAERPGFVEVLKELRLLLEGAARPATEPAGQPASRPAPAAAAAAAPAPPQPEQVLQTFGRGSSGSMGGALDASNSPQPASLPATASAAAAAAASAPALPQPEQVPQSRYPEQQDDTFLLSSIKSSITTVAPAGSGGSSSAPAGSSGGGGTPAGSGGGGGAPAGSGGGGGATAGSGAGGGALAGSVSGGGAPVGSGGSGGDGGPWRPHGGPPGGEPPPPGGPGLQDLEEQEDAGIGFKTGGAQDAATFRANIAAGHLPLPSDLTFEGLAKTYDFDTRDSDAPPCQQLFCPAYSLALASDPLAGPAHGSSAAQQLAHGQTQQHAAHEQSQTDLFLAVGLDSGLQAFQRPAVNLALLLDVSGSMGAPFQRYYSDGQGQRRELGQEDCARSKLDVAKEVVRGVVRRLRPDDAVSMSVFSDRAATPKPLGPDAADLPGILQGIDALVAGGSTNLQAGLAEALSQLLDEESGCLDCDPVTTENRVVVITDAAPNVGDLSERELLSRIKAAATDRVHITIVGVGLDFNTKLAEAIAKVRGAAYFSVHSPGEFKARVERDFEHTVAPLAFDLELRVEGAGGPEVDRWRIAKVHGSPDAERRQLSGDCAIMRVHTLFPSPKSAAGIRGGVVLLRMRLPPNAISLAAAPPLRLAVRYTDRAGQQATVVRTVGVTEAVAALEAQPREGGCGGSSPSGSPGGSRGSSSNGSGFFASSGVRKAVALARYVDAMQAWLAGEWEAVAQGEAAGSSGVEGPATPQLVASAGVEVGSGGSVKPAAEEAAATRGTAAAETTTKDRTTGAACEEEAASMATLWARIQDGQHEQAARGSSAGSAAPWHSAEQSRQRQPQPPKQPCPARPPGRWERRSQPLTVRPEVRPALLRLRQFLEGECAALGDPTLWQEVAVLDQLLGTARCR